MSLEEMEPLIFSSFRAREDLPPTRVRSRACWPILIAEGLERIAWYSLIVNLIIFLVKPPLCFASTSATVVQLTTTSVMYVIGLLGGWISDSYVGRYPTIIAGYVIYIIGYSLLLCATYYLPASSTWTYEGMLCDQQPSNITNHAFCSAEGYHQDYACSAVIFTALIVVALGAGVVRTNMAPFGGDQVSSMKYRMSSIGYRISHQSLVYAQCTV